jgi:membrane protease YdiL (CAAX protease family)
MLRVLIVILTEGLTGEVPDQHPFLEMMESDVGVAVLSLIVLTAVILAPIVEELQFRVVILGGIAQLGRSRLALGVSSVLFAFAHGFPDSLALLPLAFALGYTYLRRRSYITVMMVHFLFNAFNMVLAFASMV